MEVIVLRPCMIYGPGGKGEFLKFCRLIKKGIFPRIGLGKNLTPIVNVHDVVQAAVSALYKGRRGEIYLIASKKSPPFADIHKAITKSLQIKRIYFYVPLWVAYCVAYALEKISAITGKPPVVSSKNVISAVTDRVFDISKAEYDLGYKPTVGLFDGIKETVISGFPKRQNDVNSGR